MKTTFYSSTFFSLIIAFFAFLGIKGETVMIVQNMEHSFSNIEKPLFKFPDSESNALPITIDIFYSFGCSDCSSFGLNTIPSLQEKYLEYEDVDLKLHIIPASDNEGQYYSATAVKCAYEHGKYWEMHRKLNETTEPLSRREVDLIGQELELPILEFRNCLTGGKYDEEIGKEIDYANQKGITKIPTILIDEYKLYGSQPIENIEKIINEIRNNT